MFVGVKAAQSSSVRDRLVILKTNKVDFYNNLLFEAVFLCCSCLSCCGYNNNNNVLQALHSTFSFSLIGSFHLLKRLPFPQKSRVSQLTVM